MEESGVPGENHRPVASHWQLYHIILYQVHIARAGFELTTSVVIGTDCKGRQNNYCFHFYLPVGYIQDKCACPKMAIKKIIKCT